MKTQKLLVIVASVCLMAFFNVLSFAETTRVQSDDVQPDLAGLVAEVVAQGLAAEGYAVRLDGTSVNVATHRGDLILDLPATQEALERGEITVSVDGMVVMLDAPLLRNFSHMTGDEANGPFDLIQCIFAALDIYGLKLDICEFGDPDFLCVTEATFGLVLNILRCVGDPG